MSEAHFGFGVLAQVVLDDQVDAQPLVVPNQQITAGPYTLGSPGTYQVVYVATEANSIYAISASNGAVLLKRTLGTPVPTPLGCNANGPNVGINSTPVIDVAAQTLYVVAYTLMSGIPTYQVFALNLNDLTNKLAPVTVAASHTLSDGTTYNFNATYERQRPALIESSGIIYAGFGSFCDFAPDQSRGWLLGWQASTLAPLAANRLTDTLATGNYFLSAIWMSGYGIAASNKGNLFFSTGNSGPGTYDGVRNIQESVVKVDSATRKSYRHIHAIQRKPFGPNRFRPRVRRRAPLANPAQSACGTGSDRRQRRNDVFAQFRQLGPMSMYVRRRLQQRTRPTRNRGVLVRAVLFHRSRRGRARRKQRRRLEHRPNHRLEGTDLAHCCIRPRRSGGPCRQRPGPWHLYDGVVERHPSWDRHHMGDGAADRF